MIVSTVTHLLADPVRGRHDRQRARHRGRRRLRHLGRLCRVLLRDHDGRLVGPDGRVDVRAGDRRGAAVDITNRGDRRPRSSSPTVPAPPSSGPSETPAIGPVVWGSDGEQADLITPDRAVGPGDAGREPPQWPSLTMDGNPVFKWASFTMAKAAAEALDRAGVSPEEIEVFVPHQANMRITDAMRRALKLPIGRGGPRHRAARATPRPPRSRSPSRRCWSPARPVVARPA